MALSGAMCLVLSKTFYMTFVLDPHERMFSEVSHELCIYLLYSEHCNNTIGCILTVRNDILPLSSLFLSFSSYRFPDMFPDMELTRESQSELDYVIQISVAAITALLKGQRPKVKPDIIIASEKSYGKPLIPPTMQTPKKDDGKDTHLETIFSNFHAKNQVPFVDKVSDEQKELESKETEKQNEIIKTNTFDKIRKMTLSVERGNNESGKNCDHIENSLRRMKADIRQKKDMEETKPDVNGTQVSAFENGKITKTYSEEKTGSSGISVNSSVRMINGRRKRPTPPYPRKSQTTPPSMNLMEYFKLAVGNESVITDSLKKGELTRALIKQGLLSEELLAQLYSEWKESNLDDDKDTSDSQTNKSNEVVKEDDIESESDGEPVNVNNSKNK